MTDIRPSPEMLDAAAANRAAALEERDLKPCPHCGKPFLEGYPHRHATEIQPGYDPMGEKPETLDELIRVVRREYRLELPDRLHSRSVPANPVDMPLNAEGPDAYGPSVATLDTGPLGSPSWAPSFHRRVGGVEHWDGEQTVIEGDWGIFPWAFAIERRLDRWCRSKHGNRPDLWREHRGEVICRPLVQLVIVSDYSIDMAGLEYEMTPERARLVLADALGRVWGQVSNVLNRLPIAA